MKIPENILEQIAKGYRKDAQLFGVTIEECSLPGDNFMSLMYSVELALKSEDDKEKVKEVTRLMVKCLPQDPLCTQLVQDCDSFAKEVGMYTQVFKDMIAFQRSKSLGKSEIFRGWPEAYSADCAGDFKFLAMQDMRTKGFKMLERSSMLDMNHAKTVLQGLARFHALSLAMFGGNYDTIVSHYPFLVEQMFRDPSDISDSQKTFVEMAFSSIASILRDAGEEDTAEIWEKLNHNSQYFVSMYKLVGSSCKSAVITFGDVWKNNILFRHDPDDEGQDEPVDLSFLDFQMARVTSRATDVGYFLYTSVQLDIVIENEAELLQYYHKEFKTFLRRLGMTPKKLGCTWKNFRKEYDKYRLYGVVLGLMLMPALHQTLDGSSLKDIPSDKISCDDKANASDWLENFRHSEVTQRICVIANKHMRQCRKSSLQLE